MLMSPVFNLISVSASEACAIAILESAGLHSASLSGLLLTISLREAASYASTTFCVSLRQLFRSSAQALTQLQLSSCRPIWRAIVLSLFTFSAPFTQAFKDVKSVCECLDEVQDTARHLGFLGLWRLQVQLSHHHCSTAAQKEDAGMKND